jgi:hypothetical protein
MAISKTASITFDEFPEAITHLSYAGNLAAVGAFAAAIQPYSCATVQAYSYTEQENSPVGMTPAPGTNALEFQLIVKMRKPSQVGTVQISIPAPDMTIFDELDGAGYRLQKTAGDAIAAAYSTLRGETYVFMNGWLTS